MTIEETVLTDFPPYDSTFIRAIAFGCFFVLSPVFIMIFLFEPDWGYWGLILWIIVPAFVYSIPYLLAVPTKIVLTDERLRIKHGKLWTIDIPVEKITSSEVMDHAPWWANFQYFYPYAQWVHITKSSGFLSWWYVPTTSATQLVLKILETKSAGRY